MNRSTTRDGKRPSLGIRGGTQGTLQLLFGILLLCLTRSAASMAGEAKFLVKLNYEADTGLTGCGDEVDFRRRITRRLGADPFRDDQPITVSIRVEGTSTAIGGHVHWADAQGATMGERRFVAKDGNCGKLLAEISFAVALQIQMLGLSSSGPLPADLTPTDSTLADGALPESIEAAPAPPSPAESPKEIASPVSLWLGIGPVLATGLAPSSLWMGRALVGLQTGDLSFEFGVESHSPQTYRNWRGSGFKEWSAAIALAMCHRFGVLSGCVLGRAGRLQLSGEGLDVEYRPRALVSQAGVRAAASLGLSPSWFASVRLDALTLLTSKTIEMNGAEIWKMPRFSMLVGLDIAFRFR